jgi:hypothetical protein
MVDMQMGAEHVVDLLIGDAERKQLVAPALLAGKIERRRVALVLAGTGIDQDGVARRADDKRLIGDHHQPQRRVEHFGLHAGEVMLEDGIVISREEILRPTPRPSRSMTASMVISPILSCFIVVSLPFSKQRNGRVQRRQAAHKL